LTQLNSLYLNMNHITDISCLENLTQLHILTDLSQVKSFAKCYFLQVA
jgi:Leucine-rich repeat (LRR) protein